MLSWMYGNTMMDIIRFHEFREKLKVAPIYAKMSENRLRWFRHVQRKTFDNLVRRIESIIVEDKRSRPRKTWREQIKNNLHGLNLFENLTKDKSNVHILEQFD